MSLFNACPNVKSLIITHIATGSRRYCPIRCKQWSCSYCRRKNLKKLMARMAIGKPNKFITLTCKVNPEETVSQAYDRHRDAIRRLTVKIRKAYGSFECCTIVEATRKGNPHWHLVARSNYIPQRQLSAWWETLTGSRIVDIQAITSHKHAISYVSKYVLKTVGPNKPYWCKRVYQFTAHYGKLPRIKIPEGFRCEITRLGMDLATQHEQFHYATHKVDGQAWLFFEPRHKELQESIWSWLELTQPAQT